MAGTVILAVAMSGGYLLAVRRLAVRTPRPRAPARPAALGGGSLRWPARRTLAFLAGLAVLAGALGSGLAVGAEGLLSAHVVEHLLATMAAAPLLVAAAPLALALRALRGPPHARLAQAVRSRGARLVTHPVVAWGLYAAATLAVHVPIVYEAALRSAPLHAVEHLLLLGTAILFWLPLVGTNPVRHRLSALGAVLYLLLAMIPMTLAGVWLGASTSVLYPSLLVAARELGVDALADQGAAGAIMWLGGTLVLVGAVVGLGMQALLREERRAVARERYADGARTQASDPSPRAKAALPGAGG